MKQIKITAASVKFRGKTVFRGDVLPEPGDHEITPDELGVMVPLRASLVGEKPEPKESETTKEPEDKKPAKKSAKKKG